MTNSDFFLYIYQGTALSSVLCITFSQMNVYAKYFDKNNKCIYLLVNNKNILDKYNKIWDKIYKY